MHVLLVAAAPTPIPLVAAPMPILFPVAPAPIPVVAGMAPPPALVPLVPAVAGRVPPQARASAQVEATEPIHPLGILVKTVETELSCQGRPCKEHKMCSKVLKEDVVVHLRKMQLMVEGKEETAIAAIWVRDGINCCRVGFVPCHMVRHAAQYNGALVQVTRVLAWIRRPATRQSVLCFFRTNRFALSQSSLPCRGMSKM